MDMKDTLTIMIRVLDQYQKRFLSQETDQEFCQEHFTNYGKFCIILTLLTQDQKTLSRHI